MTKPCGSGTAFFAAVFFTAGYSPDFFFAACARLIASRCVLPDHPSNTPQGVSRHGCVGSGTRAGRRAAPGAR
ncbi:hypothetical protein [Streptomyces sannanensis]